MENHLVGFPGPHSLFSRTLEMPRCPPKEEELAWNEAAIADHRANAGVQTQGRLAGASLLLLTTTGAKSGEKRTRPLGFIQEGDVYVVVGSNWGQETVSGLGGEHPEGPEGHRRGGHRDVRGGRGGRHGVTSAAACSTR